jgi:hypothetical protein
MYVRFSLSLRNEVLATSAVLLGETMAAVARITRADLLARMLSMELTAAIERVRQFSQTWKADDVVDQESGLTGADLQMVVDHLLLLTGDIATGTTD